MGEVNLSAALSHADCAAQYRESASNGESRVETLTKVARDLSRREFFSKLRCGATLGFDNVNAHGCSASQVPRFVVTAFNGSKVETAFDGPLRKDRPCG
jgi:hypothetical protein